MRIKIILEEFSTQHHLLSNILGLPGQYEARSVTKVKGKGWEEQRRVGPHVQRTRPRGAHLF
jgi:hypothetical protein